MSFMILRFSETGKHIQQLLSTMKHGMNSMNAGAAIQ